MLQPSSSADEMITFMGRLRSDPLRKKTHDDRWSFRMMNGLLPRRRSIERELERPNDVIELAL